ncbi:phage holin family protein [Roseibium sp.]|uniref:phage holin family protein n=1 Tax=Roseibium sp. TaxID=1936156 RepID=UPI003A9819B5
MTIPDPISDPLKGPASIRSTIADLCKTEFRLLRSEIAEKSGLIVNGLIAIAAGAVLALPATFMVLMSASAALAARGIADPLAHLIVGALTLCVAGALVWYGRRRLAPEQLALTRTVRQLKKDLELVKEAFQ